MEAAIDYAEASRNARDLFKLAKLTKQQVEVSIKDKGQPRTTEVKEYGEVCAAVPHQRARVRSGVMLRTRLARRTSLHARRSSAAR
eukprot:3174267-Prymnesium_polylepis.1